MDTDVSGRNSWEILAFAEVNVALHANPHLHSSVPVPVYTHHRVFLADFMRDSDLKNNTNQKTF